MVDTLHLTPQETVSRLVQHIHTMQAEAGGKRIAIGFVGGPGAGKSTIAARIVDQLNASQPGTSALVPMDGFHMKHAKIVSLGLEDRKGAPHTFEGASFVSFLSGLKTATGDVDVPGYSRKIEDTVDKAFTVPLAVHTLIVEGNYLLLGDAPWSSVRDLLDYAVFIHVDRELVKARLLKRHGEEGLFSEERNRAHIERNDLPNFDLVDQTRHRADLVVELNVTQ
jgi:pantothenate kinase